MFKQISLLLTFVLMSLSAQSQDIDQIYKMYFYGDNNGTIAAIQKMASADPESYDKQFYLYSLLNATNHYEEAQKVLTHIKNDASVKAYKTTAEILERINAGANGTDLQSELEKAIRGGRKSKGFLSLMIGEQFLYGPNKDAKLAIVYIKDAVDSYKMGDATTRMLLGDAYALKGDAGNAVTNYEYAADMDKTNAVPNYKIGRAYLAGKNYEFGIPAFKAAIAADPTFALVYRDLGYYYYELNQYPEAKRNFERYLALTKPTVNDRLWYANTLYLNRDFPEAINALKAVKNDAPGRYYIDRLLAYSYYDDKKYEEADQSINEFFANHDTVPLIASDFEYAGRIDMALGKDSLAYLQWMKAYQMDSNKITLVKEIADTLYARKKYAESGYYFNVVAKNTNLAIDYYYATRADYLGNSFMRGDSAAQGIINKIPEDPTGYLWRARHNAQLDTLNAGLAEPFYAKVIELGDLNKEKYKKELTEAANWMTGYYIRKNDLKTANTWNDKALEYDDTNAQTLNYMDYLSNPAPPETPKPPVKKK
ncbi:MAG TPA: CDC27 family protein [Saprospiraceae bacterium]|nr:CDC27 family protein [Saprospiraceae bacterium]